MPAQRDQNFWNICKRDWKSKRLRTTGRIKQVCANFFKVSHATKVYGYLRKSASALVKICEIPHCFDPHSYAEIRIQICKTLQKSALKSVKLYGLMQKDAKFCGIMHNYMDSASKSAWLCRNPHQHLRKFSTKIRTKIRILICKCEHLHYLPPRILKLTSHILGIKALLLRPKNDYCGTCFGAFGLLLRWLQ